MTKLFLSSLAAFLCLTVVAQKSPKAKTATKKPATTKSTITPAANARVDTATFTGVHIDENKVKSFDPMNSKIRTLPVKTPVYQPNVTGSHAPGDGRMGIPVQTATPVARPDFPIAADSLKSKINGN